MPSEEWQCCALACKSTSEAPEAKPEGLGWTEWVGGKAQHGPQNARALWL